MNLTRVAVVLASPTDVGVVAVLVGVVQLQVGAVAKARKVKRVPV